MSLHPGLTAAPAPAPLTPTAASTPLPLVHDELDLLAQWVPLDACELIELGCGAAALARDLLTRYPGASVTGLEVDERQHAKNLAAPRDRLRFVAGGAQAIPFEAERFDGALMLKSLHHVPMPLMAQALAEARRVLRPGAFLYVSEPVFDGPFNELVRLFNDEGVVRAAAQAALDTAIAAGGWRQTVELRFNMPVHFPDFQQFERRMMQPTFADHDIDAAKRSRVQQAFEQHLGPDGVFFERPMHVRLLRKADAASGSAT